METFWIQGVVRNGQVVLDRPLDLPDGTIVTVKDYDPDDDPRPSGPEGPLPLTEVLRIMTEFTGRADLAEEYLRNHGAGSGEQCE